MQQSFLASPSSIASEQTFTTCNTFLRLPRRASADGADVAILGIPFDLATSNRPGARFGPAAIRAASAGLAELKAYPGGFDPLAHLNCADLGDVNFDPGNPHRIVERYSCRTKRTRCWRFSHQSWRRSFRQLPFAEGARPPFGPLALVHFDAHTDTWRSPNGLNEPAELNHGTMFSRAIDEGLIVPENSVQIGIRTWVDDPMGITILDNEQVDAQTPVSLARTIYAITNGRACYVTVDIDCLDPAYAPGTGTPVTGGLSPLKLLQILRSIEALPIVGFDIVEVAPPYDHAGITALNAATIAYEQICRLALRRGAVAKRYRA